MVSRQVALRRRRTVAVAAALVTFSTIMFVSCDDDEPVAISDIPSSREDFIEFVADAAAVSQDEYGVPPSVSMAQAILESNWGQSELTKKGFAFFGIKCTGDSPHASGCAELPTTECDANGCRTVNASFRTYDSPADSFADHGYLLAENSRYADAFDHTDDPAKFATEIADAGYATDPQYPIKLVQLMDKYDLYQYD